MLNLLYYKKFKLYYINIHGVAYFTVKLTQVSLISKTYINYFGTIININ